MTATDADNHVLNYSWEKIVEPGGAEDASDFKIDFSNGVRSRRRSLTLLELAALDFDLGIFWTTKMPAPDSWAMVRTLID